MGKKLAYESYELVVLRISMFWCFGRKWGMKGMSVFIYLDLLFSLCAVTPRSSYPVQDSWPKHQDLHDSWPRNINWSSKNSLLPSLTNDFLTPSFLNQWLASASTQGKKNCRTVLSAFQVFGQDILGQGSLGNDQSRYGWKEAKTCNNNETKSH